MKNLLLLIISIFSTCVLHAQCTDNGNYWNKSWVSCTTSENPNTARGNSLWLLYEFQEAQYIDSSYIWNANRAGESGWGANEVIIDYSIDGDTWIELDEYTFPQAPETDTYTGFLGPNFGGVYLQKILITILSTHDGGSCASLAEVQFKIDQSACYGTIDACGICNGPGEITWYLDADNDGLGDANNTVSSCTPPLGYVADNTDLCDNGYLGWEDVSALFASNGCNNCHGGNASGGLDLRTYATTALGGNRCGTDLLTGTKFVDIITTSDYNGCDETIFGPSMNDRSSGEFDAQELALLQAWIDGGAPESVIVRINTLLEGVYDASNSAMRTDLQASLPLTQPFNRIPWNYTGAEQLSSIPSTMVDWVLVEVRAANNESQLVAEKAAILLSNGDIVDNTNNYNGVRFNCLDASLPYYFIIRTRNHIAVMSDVPLIANANNLHNFANPATIRGGSTQLSNLGDGNYGLIAGDYNSDGVISLIDFNGYADDLSQINTYLDSDLNLDGVVTVSDFNTYLPNASKIGVFTVRY